MAKVLLLSILVALVVIPILASRERHPVRALKQLLFFTLAFNLVYVFVVLVLYPHFAFR